MLVSSRRRRGFTLVEVSLGLALAVLVLIAAFQVLISGSRNTEALTRGLKANEALLSTYKKLSKDVRQAKEVRFPTLAEADVPPPPFSFVSETEGTHVLNLDTYRIAYVDGEFKVLWKYVRWNLGNPKEVESRQGTKVTIYELFRAESEESESPLEAPDSSSGSFGTVGSSFDDSTLKPAEKVGEGILELIFFRRKRNNLDPQPDPRAGPRNLLIQMKAARVRNVQGRVSLGYEASLDTTIFVRGVLK